jgi:hypothetical protein
LSISRSFFNGLAHVTRTRPFRVSSPDVSITESTCDRAGRRWLRTAMAPSKSLLYPDLFQFNRRDRDTTAQGFCFTRCSIRSLYLFLFFSLAISSFSFLSLFLLFVCAAMFSCNGVLSQMRKELQQYYQ